MTRRVRKAPSASASRGITPVYEGPEVLGALLSRAGSPFDVGEVSARFAAAVAAGEPRSAVIPSLFEQEPHFPSPDDARRLYANLFGLWGRIADGRGPHDDAPEVVAEPTPPPTLPDRGTGRGSTCSRDFVDGVWRMLAALPEREVRRLRDRFTNTQPDVGTWLDEQPLADPAVAPARELAFETWAMFDQCFGERLGVATWDSLRTFGNEPPPLEADHPALATYVAEQLDNLGDDDPGFGAAERAQVERAIAALAAALSEAIAEPS